MSSRPMNIEKLGEKYLKALFAVYLDIQNNNVGSIQQLLVKYHVAKGVGTSLVKFGYIKKIGGAFVWVSKKMPDMELAKAIVEDVRNQNELCKKARAERLGEQQPNNPVAEKQAPDDKQADTPLKVVPFQTLLPTKMSRTTDDFFTASVISFMSRVEAQNEAILSTLKSIKGVLEDIKKGQQDAAATASMSSQDESRQLPVAM